MSDDIEIDESPEEVTPAPVKVKSGVPVWAVLLVVISFVCLAAALALQIVEYQYFSDL